MAKKSHKKTTVGKAVDKAKQAMSSAAKPEERPATTLAVSEKKEVAVKSTAPTTVAVVKKPEAKTEPKAEVKPAAPAPKTEEKPVAKEEEKKEISKSTEKPAEKKAAPAKKAAPKTSSASKKTAPAKKAAPAKKPATRRTAAKSTEVPTFDTFLEYNGDQINVSPEQIRARIEEAYKADGHRPGNIRSLQVYLNLDERRAYYVINGNPENKFVEI